MSEQMNGIQSMRSRVTRTPRAVLPPTKVAPAIEGGGETPTPPPPVVAVTNPATPETETAAIPTVRPTAQPSRPAPKAADRDAKADAAALTTVKPVTVQVSARVPEHLDERLNDVVYLLGKQRVETSKSELLTMFLAELPEKPDDALKSRLHAYRDRTQPRSA